MRTKSIFCAECICGRYFETEEREHTCPSCKRIIVLDWECARELEAHIPRNPERPEVAA